jgi:hypothetical protein
LLVIVPIVVFLPFFSCLEWHDERTKQWIEHQDQKLNVNDCKKALQFLKRKGIEQWNKDEVQLWLEIVNNGDFAQFRSRFPFGGATMAGATEDVLRERFGEDGEIIYNLVRQSKNRRELHAPCTTSQTDTLFLLLFSSQSLSRKVLVLNGIVLLFHCCYSLLFFVSHHRNFRPYSVVQLYQAKMLTKRYCTSCRKSGTLVQTNLVRFLFLSLLLNCLYSFPFFCLALYSDIQSSCTR